MPNAPALNSAFGNGPQDINSPVPAAGPGPAGGSPAANLPAGNPGAGAGGGAGAPPAALPRHALPNPFDKPLTQDEQQRVKEMKAGVNNPFDEKDPNFPTGYTPLSPRLRRTPAGDLEHLRNDGRWAALGDTEKKILGDFMDQVDKWGLRAKEDLPRFFGAVAGGMIGGRFGGGAAALGAAGGQALAGAAANAMQGKENSTGSVATDALSGAAAEILPRGVGKMLEGQAAAWGARAAEAPIVKAGSEALASRAQSRQGAADQLGLTLRPDQIMPENGAVTRPVDQIMSGGGPEAQKLAAAQALQKQMLLEKRDQIVSRLQGPYQGEIGDQGSNFSQVMGTILNNHETAIASLKGRAYQEARGKVFSMDPVLNSMQEKIQDKVKANIFKDNGAVDARLLQELKDRYGGIPEDAKPLVGDYMRLFNAAKTGAGVSEVGAFRNTGAADRTIEPVGGTSDQGVAMSASGGQPRSTPGLTLEEMDVFRKKFGDYANFQASRERTATERAYGDIYYATRSHMDSKIIETMNPVDPAASARLMAHKEFYSQFKEDAMDFQKKIEHDPTNAATALVDGQDPAKVKSLLALVDDKQRKYLAGGFLDNLTQPLIDATSGKMRVTPIETAWRKVDPKVKQMLFGEDVKTIDSLVNYSRAIEARDMSSYDPTKDALTQRALGAIRGLKETSKGSLDFISRLFQKSPKARDYLVGNAADILMPEGGSPEAMARRQMLMQHAAQATLSAPARLGAKAIGADFASPHPSPSPMPMGAQQ